MRYAVLLPLVLALSRSPSLAQDLPSASNFLSQVYAPYVYPNSKWQDVHWTRWATPDLIALLKRSRQLTPSNEIGSVGGDPICDCQERDLHDLAIKTEPTGVADVIGSASFINAGQQKTIRFRLVATARTWRIADIMTADMPSLRRFLEEDITRRTGRRNKSVAGPSVSTPAFHANSPAHTQGEATDAAALARSGAVSTSPFNLHEIPWDETDLPSLLLLRFLPQKSSSATGWTNWAMRQQMLERGQLPNLNPAAWPRFFTGRNAKPGVLSALQLTPPEMQAFQDWNIQRSRALPPVIVQSVPFALPPTASPSDKTVRPLGAPANASDDEQRVTGIGLTQIVYLGLARDADEDAVEIPGAVAVSLPRSGVRLETRLRWLEPKRVDGTLLFPGVVQSLRLVAGSRLLWEHRYPDAADVPASAGGATESNRTLSTPSEIDK